MSLHLRIWINHLLLYISIEQNEVTPAMIPALTISAADHLVLSLFHQIFDAVGVPHPFAHLAKVFCFPFAVAV